MTDWFDRLTGPEQEEYNRAAAASAKRVRELEKALEKIAAFDPSDRDAYLVYMTDPPKNMMVAKCVEIARLVLSHTKEGENG